VCHTSQYPPPYQFRPGDRRSLSYLEVEHAGLGGGVVLLAAALLEEAVDLWERRDC